ncbi:unnamed protein product [Meloidogyne enterolobii]|uniref:Uncharacterized protein n=1 Tax=Meloidogyne enterolobii TaxID=390850 RepID=A0ACB0ZEB0_MELEN
MSASKRRLVKELSQLVTEPPAGVRLLQEENCDSLSCLNTLYEGEVFQLQFKFDDQYPFSSPEVTFIGENIPVHPHVYSNGHICLSILSDDWTPVFYFKFKNLQKLKNTGHSQILSNYTPPFICK